jgi:L-lactate utilization protein LutB
MGKLQAARAETTEAFLAEAGPELAALCTACGACFNACPIVDHLGLRASGRPASFVGTMLGLSLCMIDRDASSNGMA